MQKQTAPSRGKLLTASVKDDGLFRDVNQHTMRAFVVLLNKGHNALESANICFGHVAAAYVVAALMRLYSEGGVK